MLWLCACKGRLRLARAAIGPDRVQEGGADLRLLVSVPRGGAELVPGCHRELGPRALAADTRRPSPERVRVVTSTGEREEARELDGVEAEERDAASQAGADE